MLTIVEDVQSGKLNNVDLLLLLGLGVDVSKDSNVRKVYPELTQQSSHPVTGMSKTER